MLQLTETPFYKRLNEFDDMENDLLRAVLNENPNNPDEYPSKSVLNTISVVSAYYPYTNPPPMGYGTPAPKTAESISRAWNYNLKPMNKTVMIGDYIVNNPEWEKGDFPLNECHGNFHPPAARRMFSAFLYKNCPQIIKCAKETIQEALNTNASILTKGRQTWDPLTEKSIPCSLAYRRMERLINNNLGPETMNCFDFIARYNKLKSLEYLKASKRIPIEAKRTHYDPKTNQRITRVIKKSIVQKVTIEGPHDGHNLTNVRNELREAERSFCSYIKHGERAKLNRRAIASANIILRMYLHLIEEFHLKIGKIIPGSTISIGGEEKKKKITTELCDAEAQSAGIRTLKCQSTQDATKWNECLSADLFALFHMVLFNDKIRKEIGAPCCSNEEKLFLDICLHGHFLLAIKKISLGETPMCKNENYFNRPSWDNLDLRRLNTKTREMFTEIEPYRKGMYLEASPGMLMGMHNALSTTVALAAVGYGLKEPNQAVATLRSSDDSTTAYYASDWVNLRRTINNEIKALKMLGINMSLDKTFYFRYNFSEYTSWYIDGKFVSQYGVETSTLRPQGKNPPDDFYSIAIGTSVSLQRLEMNSLGAEAKIRIGVDNCRRVWRVPKNPTKRPGISGEVLLLSDGGLNPYNSGLCNIEETAIKKYRCTNDVEKDYIEKVRNQNHPFSSAPIEDITYSIDHGRLMVGTTETPRTIFHFIKRTNRTSRGKGLDKQIAIEKKYTEAVKILEAADVTTMMRTPSHSSSMAKHVLSMLKMYQSSSKLTPDEFSQYTKAIERLTGVDGDEEIMDVDLDVDL